MSKDRLYNDKPKIYFEGANPIILRKISSNASNVLDVGCANGNLGAAIRTRGISVYGIELFPAAAKMAETKLNHVLCGDIETMDLPYKKHFFDHIVFGDVLEHLVDPWAVLQKVKPFLKKTGSILACIPNVGHISIIKGLLSGKWTYVFAGLLDQTHLRFFTLDEMKKMFHSSGYSVTDVERINHFDVSDTKLLNHLNSIRAVFNLGFDQFPVEAKVLQYVVEAKVL